MPPASGEALGPPCQGDAQGGALSQQDEAKDVGSPKGLARTGHPEPAGHRARLKQHPVGFFFIAALCVLLVSLLHLGHHGSRFGIGV